jgi:hypothetical protein
VKFWYQLSFCFAYQMYLKLQLQTTLDKQQISSRVLQLFKAQWLLYVPPGLTLNNSTFCPHSVFMYFVWISEQTAIIFLYSINSLVCIT